MPAHQVKNREHRVGATPELVRELCASGHKVVVETKAGSGIDASDTVYRAAGAKITKSPKEVFGGACMVIKVKEP